MLGSSCQREASHSPIMEVEISGELAIPRCCPTLRSALKVVTFPSLSVFTRARGKPNEAASYRARLVPPTR
jgi:hypothetical protein